MNRTTQSSTPTPIRAARDRHRLADVAARTAIPLAARTGTVTVRCPMPSHGHPDRTPSMRLYLDDDHFYCFGCGARGDVVQWVRNTSDLGVIEAIRRLDSGQPIVNAWRAATPVHHQSHVATTGTGAGRPGTAETPDPVRTPPERIAAASADAWTYYSAPSRHVLGRTYLAGRRIGISVLEGYTGRPEVGHTPASPDGLTQTLRRHGYGETELVDAGLAVRYQADGPLRDFYRHRVLIPIRDADGQVVGIVGRNTAHARWPKYKNPPRTAIYDKSIHLYQPLPAPTDPEGRVVVVEGTFDASAIAIAALRTGTSHLLCPVTQSGRELSPKQIDSVLALSPNPPLLSFDSDQAGQESTRRYLAAFRERGVAAEVAELPAGHDPASWLAERGAQGLARWLSAGGFAGSGVAVQPAGFRSVGLRGRLQGWAVSVEVSQPAAEVAL